MAKPKLTVKQAKFVKGVAEGKTKREAAMLAYETDDPNTASSIARENLQKTSVLNALHIALEKAGITPEMVVAPVGEALLHDDLDMRLKGHDRAVKIMNINNKDGGNTIIFNLNKSTKRFIDAD